VSQIVQIAGSLLVLTAFALGQRGVLDQKSLIYLALNLVGSMVLAVEAAHGRLWGFLLLEGVWALVSAVGLVQVLRTRGPIDCKEGPR
jgi:hypothetical protein